MRKLFMFIFMCMISIGIVACSDQEADGPLTLNYYGKPDEALENEIIALFEEENPDIKINYIATTGGSNEKLMQLQTVLQSGSKEIDLFAADAVWPSIFISAGWVAPLEDIGMTNEFLDDYFMYENFQADGKSYGIPFQANAGTLFYRTDLLDKYDLDVPETWEDLKLAAETVLAGEDNDELYGYAGAWQRTEGLAAAAFEHFWAEGSYIYKDGVVDAEVADIEAAISFMKSLIDSGVTPTEAPTFGAQQRDMYKAGKLVFARGWSGDATAHFLNANGNPYATTTGITSLPGTGGAIGNWALMISANSDHKEEALKFAEFRASKEILLLQNERIGSLPTRTDAFNNPQITSKLGDYADEMLDLLQNSESRALTPFYGELSMAIQTNVHSALTGIITPLQAATIISNEAKRILK